MSLCCQTHASQNNLVLAVSGDVLVGQANDVEDKHTIVDAAVGTDDCCRRFEGSLFREQFLGLHRRCRVIRIWANRSTLRDIGCVCEEISTMDELGTAGRHHIHPNASISS